MPLSVKKMVSFFFSLKLIKHQNIKIKEKVKFSDKEKEEKNIETEVIDNLKQEVEVYEKRDNESKNKPIQNEAVKFDANDSCKLEIACENMTSVNNNMGNNKNSNDIRNNIPMILEMKGNNQVNKKMFFENWIMRW